MSAPLRPTQPLSPRDLAAATAASARPESEVSTNVSPGRIYQDRGDASLAAERRDSFKQDRPVSILTQQRPPRTAIPVRTQVEIASGLSLPSTLRESPDAPTRVLAILAHLERNLQPSHYDHTRRIDLEAGLVRCDCSQLVGAILEEAAPAAASEASGLAARIFAGIRRVDPARPSEGWQRILRIADLRPGDVIAWPTPPGLPSRVSGHVVIAVGPPEAYRNGYLVRIADSTSLPHGEDTRAGGSG
ncbi:hypothetical protein F9K50_05445, partial [bacterium]